MTFTSSSTVVRTSLLAAAFAWVMTGCHSTSTKTPKEIAVNSTAEATEVVEPLKSLARTKAGLTVRVYTGGCTDKSHFAWKQVPAGELSKKAPAELIMVRTQKDNCYAHIPEGMVIDFSYAELGLKPDAVFTVGNPVIMQGVESGE